MKILFVEKEGRFGDVLNMLLKSFRYDVTTLNGSSDAMTAIKVTSPDLILIDRDLQDKDGIEISKSIKKDFLTAYIPIIVLIDRRQVRRDLLEIEQGIDDYIVKPPDPIDLQIRIEMAVRRATHQFFANGLTRLPGNRTIEVVLRKIIESGKDFSFGYIDIDRFKNFNDNYGYLKGDEVIIQTSQIITRTIKTIGNQDDFVGHIGGDDFVFITTPDTEEAVSLEIIKEFDRLIPCHYSKQDRLKRFIESSDREGKLCQTPLMTISIALINNCDIKIDSLVQLSEIVTEIKSYLKTITGSKFLQNRRVHDKGIRTRARHANSIKKRIERFEKKANSKKPLGQLLVDADLINGVVLDEALLRHWRTGQQLGQVLVGLGLVKEEDIFKMLKSQGIIF